MYKPTRVARKKKKKKVLTEEEKHLPEAIGIFPVEAIAEGPVAVGEKGITNTPATPAYKKHRKRIDIHKRKVIAFHKRKVIGPKRRRKKTG